MTYILTSYDVARALVNAKRQYPNLEIRVTVDKSEYVRLRRLNHRATREITGSRQLT